jgi:hypothetical protein
MLYNIEIAQAFSAENTIKQLFFIRVCSTLSRMESSNEEGSAGFSCVLSEIVRRYLSKSDVVVLTHRIEL